MPRRTTVKPTGIGRAIENDRQRRAKQPEQKGRLTGVAAGQSSKSVLEQNSLDDYIATAELADADVEVLSGRGVQEEGARIISSTIPAMATPDAVAQARAADVVVPIPRRAAWDDETGADELAQNEGQEFLKWRRGLAKMEEDDGFIMTPYEKNLDFWRQLWRTVERSDVLVQILDSRDPMFYRSRDLENYVREFTDKRHLLLLNKADFLPVDLRRRWASFFKSCNVDFIFFSALRELHKQNRLPGTKTDSDARSGLGCDSVNAGMQLPPHGPLVDDGHDVLDTSGFLEELRARLPANSDTTHRNGTVGFVGYPNVGKSSVINALFGAKKVSMSRTPGKTKHLQTLELLETGITLCDCPGLVFPSVVATRAHLTINGTVPLDELRDHLPPVRLVVERIGMEQVLEKYGIGAPALREGAERRGDSEPGSGRVPDQVGAFLAGFAASRRHFLRLGVPDEAWAAHRVLKDYCSGELLHCCEPLAATADDAAPIASESLAVGAMSVQGVQAEASGSDYSDLDEFLHADRAASDGRRTRKRKGQPKKGAGLGRGGGGYAPG